MHKQHKSFLSIVLLVLMAGFMFMEYFTDPLLHAPEGYFGIPASSTDYPDLSMEIQQVVEDDSRIYVLFAGSRRIIQVYDLEGHYQSTLFFYSHYDNGVFQITTEANTLYVADECENVYVFRDGLFEQFYKEADATEHLTDIDFDWRYSSKSYMIRNGSVWKKLRTVMFVSWRGRILLQWGWAFF